MNDYKLGRYYQQNQETRWATEEEIRKATTRVDLSQTKYSPVGLPVLSDGKVAYVDDKDTHSLIFGSTGSKKTRLFVMPLLSMLTRAGESFVATDPKGELYARTSGLAKANGYDVIVINLREIGKGSMWNPLHVPYTLYKAGKIDMAVSMLNDFVSAIAAPQVERANDAFWPQMASSYILALLLLLMECASPEEANVASVGALCNESAVNSLTKLADFMRDDTVAGMNFKATLYTPERTRESILASAYGMVRTFNTQRELCNMLSGNTVDLKQIGRRKTALYLIIPDEKTTNHFLITMFLKQAYEILIAEAQKEENRELPVRVNFVLNEFCNIPHIPDMPAMISAARSRNMRYYLVVQSMHQLSGLYKEDADTIKGNCDNWVFLTSKELVLLNEISDLCGSVFSPDGSSRRLISVSQLQRLKKEKGEALIMHCRSYPIISLLADIDSYEMFKGYPAVPMDNIHVPEAKVFSSNELLRKVVHEECPVPFGNNAAK